jgi:hypothetical protein
MGLIVQYTGDRADAVAGLGGQILDGHCTVSFGWHIMNAVTLSDNYIAFFFDLQPDSPGFFILTGCKIHSFKTQKKAAVRMDSG